MDEGQRDKIWLAEEIWLLQSMVILLRSEPGDETAPVYKRTIARLEALDALKANDMPDEITLPRHVMWEEIKRLRTEDEQKGDNKMSYGECSKERANNPCCATCGAVMMPSPSSLIRSGWRCMSCGSTEPQENSRGSAPMSETRDNSTYGEAVEAVERENFELHKRVADLTADNAARTSQLVLAMEQNAAVVRQYNNQIIKMAEEIAALKKEMK